MTTKVKPTVEKWEESVQAILKKHINVPVGNYPETYKNVYVGDLYPLVSDLSTLLALSLQEAKAEGAQEAMKEAVNNFRWILEKTLPETGAWVDRDGKPITAEEIAYLVDVEYGVDLLSTINTKPLEEKV